MATNFQKTTGAPLELPQWNGERFQFEDVNQALKTVNTFAEQSNAGLAGKAAGATELLANRIYPGVDLSVVFAAEIATHSDVWAWVKARAKAANFSGIHVGDYIPFVAGGNIIKAEVAGLDTYYQYGDTPVEHHIDFISRDCWPDAHVWNKANYNNGLTANANPYLCSDIYAWLNSLAMSVPNAATANPATVAVNYTSTGVYDKLPTPLKNAIVQKRALVPSRFTAGALLIDDNSWAWQDVGKLWLPSEVEVYGCTMWGTTLSPYQGFSGGGYVQYPIFAQNMHRIKRDKDGGVRSSWWLSTALGGNSAYCAIVYYYGYAYYYYASSTAVRAPLCFRIA